MKAKRIRYRYKSSAQLKSFRTVITDKNRNHGGKISGLYGLDDFQIELIRMDLGLPQDVHPRWLRDTIRMKYHCPKFLKDFLTVRETEKSIIYHSLAAKDCLRNKATYDSYYFDHNAKEMQDQQEEPLGVENMVKQPGGLISAGIGDREDNDEEDCYLYGGTHISF